MAGHTPGPWHVGDEFGAHQLRPSIRILRDVAFVEGVRPTTYVIGEVTYPTTTGNTVGAAERAANARLIAAAPDLLAALKAVMAWAAPIAGDNNDYEARTAEIASVELALAAIAKATEPQA